MSVYKDYTDDQLAALLQAGDRLAYEVIFSRYQEILFRHAFRFLRNQDEAEDVIQDIFLMLWVKRQTLTFSSSLPAYLYSAVRNRILNHLAHQKVIARYLDSIRDFMENGVYQADEQLREKELASIIEKEVAALPERMRIVFRLSREESRSHKEIAQLLSISDKTSKQQLYKAVKILKLKLSTIISILSGLLFTSF